MSGCSSHSEVKINNLIKNTNFKQKDIDKIYEYAKKFPNNTQLSIAKIKNGQVYFYGLVLNDNIIKTIDNHNNIFKIGSITKIFTSTFLAQMVIDKKLNLDDNIQDKLKIKLLDNPTITYKQLLNHTSGLHKGPYYKDKNHYENYNYKDLENYLENKLKIDKQNEFNYSNLGASILGYTLGNIKNKSYEELLQELTHKLNMNNTTTIKSKIKNKLILPSKIDYNIPPAMISAGGIYSSVEDLSKFAIALFDDKNKALKLTQKVTFTDKTLFGDSIKMGLGWFISNEKFTENIHHHEGLIGGYTSSIFLDIKNKNAIIILSHQASLNDNEPNDIGSLSFDLMKLMY
jgi:CubicO group peptidase (beta-lactamase class C family)